MNKANQTTPIKVRTVEINAGNDGQRIDNYLLTALKGVPRTHIYQILRTGQVRVNKGRIKPNYRLKAGDLVRIPPVRTATGTDSVPTIPNQVIEILNKSVLYEDNDYLIINKPSGMAVHGGSGLRFGVIECLRVIRTGLEYLELAHRLDRETSGCLLLAKNRQALLGFHKSLQEGNVDKHYLALLKGRWQGGSQIVTAPLRKNVKRGGERMVEISEDGKEAVSRFKLVSNYEDCCMVEVKLDTGRTHQIRVHAAHIGHPVAGDSKYGDRNFNSSMKSMGLHRLFLHAHMLAFTKLDGNQDVHISAPLGDDLTQVLDGLTA